MIPDMRAALVATTSALSFILVSQNSCAKVHRKLKPTSFKTDDEKSSVGDIIHWWESELEALGQEMSVAVIVNEGMTTGYPLYGYGYGTSISLNEQRRSAIDQFKRSRSYHELERWTVQTRLSKFLFSHATELHFNHAKNRNWMTPRAGQCSVDWWVLRCFLHSIAEH